MQVFPLLRAVPALLLAAALFPGVAAAELRFYGGLGIGYTGVELDQEPAVIGEFVIPRDLEGTAFATKQFLGWRLNDYLAVEGGYFRYGSVNDSALISLTPAADANYSIKIDGFEFYALGIYPINQDLEAFAKLGLVHWDSRFTIQFGDARLKGDRDGDDLAFGLGLNFLTAGRFQARVELQVPDIDAVDLNWNVMASGIYAFKLGR